MKQTIFSLVLLLIVTFSSIPVCLSAEKMHEPVDVVFMTTPFGTHMYNVGAAAEQVFHTAGSWVRIKHQETAGAMYMYRYIVQNREKMAKGEVNHTVAIGSTGIVNFLAKGQKPFEKFPWASVKSLVSSPAVMGVYVTFDPDIKTLKDLAGKRVGTGERSRPFQGILLDKPLFGSMGIYDKIKWAPLGAMGCKDALMNGKIDATPLRLMGMLMQDSDGNFFSPKAAAGPASMEILNSGKKINFISMDPESLLRVEKIPGALSQTPIMLKKGAVNGLEQDVPGRAGPGAVLCDANLPDDIVAEIVRVWAVHRKDFAKYHDLLNFLPMTPYPLGSKENEVHPGTIKAMHQMGLPLPKIK